MWVGREPYEGEAAVQQDLEGEGDPRDRWIREQLALEREPVVARYGIRVEDGQGTEILCLDKTARPMHFTRGPVPIDQVPRHLDDPSSPRSADRSGGGRGAARRPL